VVDEATADGPPRRRTSWSLKSIVEDVAGVPIGDLQDPSKPVHPYLRGKIEPPGEARVPRIDAPDAEPPYDPVANLYPPLTGPVGRDYHGAEHEHHRETLDRHRPPADEPGTVHRSPGPSHRPERLYLHYLLLHVDRLSDSGLRYLRHAVEEELAHRARCDASPASSRE